MKKNTKIIISVVVVLAIIVSIVAYSMTGKGNGKAVSTNNKSNSAANKKDKPKTANKTDLKDNKNVASIKKDEKGDVITVTINGKDTASITELKVLALKTANELKKENSNKKVVVNAVYKNNQVENVNLGNKSNESEIYFETKPMYDPILKCIRFKIHNINNISKVQVLLDNKAIEIGDKQVLKTKNDVLAVKDITQDFKSGKIILQDKNGKQIDSNF